MHLLSIYKKLFGKVRLVYFFAIFTRFASMHLVTALWAQFHIVDTIYRSLDVIVFFFYIWKWFHPSAAAQTWININVPAYGSSTRVGACRSWRARPKCSILSILHYSLQNILNRRKNPNNSRYLIPGLCKRRTDLFISLSFRTWS